MGLGAEKQLIKNNNLSTGLISIGEAKDNPNGLFTDNADGTIDINFGGKYLIVDRINIANARFYTPQPEELNWVATSNLNYTSLNDGNVLITVSILGIVEVMQLVSGAAALPVYSSSEPHLNDHVQIGVFEKSGSTIIAGSLAVIQTVNNNIHNKNRNVVRTIGTINSQDNTIVVSPIAATIGIATSAGTAFIAGEDGFAQTEGFNPNQFTITASSPTLILKVTRDNVIQSITFALDVNNFESSPGTITAKGAARATNNFIVAFAFFNAELLGQQEFSGATRVAVASAFDEDPDFPELVIFGGKIAKVAIDVGATDLTLAAQALFTVLKQFR